jgi:SAM-dependent methyltransferase
MGIDVATLSLLARARAQGASFERSITIGRQRLYIQPAHFGKAKAKLAGLVGTDWPAVEAALGDPGGLFEPLFRALGAKRTDSLDYSPYEGASVLQDMNAPIPDSLRGKYSLVFDGGCLEHVFNFPVAMRNCLEMVEPGGHFITMTTANNYCGHGFYQFSPELMYRVLGPENGYAVKEAVLVEILPERNRFFQVPDPAVLRRRVDIRNATPTLLWVCARRTEVKPVFAAPPFQSDYAATWDASGGPHVDHLGAAKIRNPRGTWKDTLLKVVPGGWLHFARRLNDALREPLARTPGLQQIDAFDVRSATTVA